MLIERLAVLERIDQFHDESHAGIEVPACLEIGGDAPQRLMRLAQQDLFLF